MNQLNTLEGYVTFSRMQPPTKLSVTVLGIF
jgi:hypothetical protein